MGGIISVILVFIIPKLTLGDSRLRIQLFSILPEYHLFNEATGMGRPQL